MTALSGEVVPSGTKNFADAVPAESVPGECLVPESARNARSLFYGHKIFDGTYRRTYFGGKVEDVRMIRCHHARAELNRLSAVHEGPALASWSAGFFQ
jgi:hypothetical protein